MEKNTTSVIAIISTVISIASLYIGAINNNRVDKLEQAKLAIQRKDSEAKRAIDSLDVIAAYEAKIQAWQEKNNQLAGSSTFDKKITINSNATEITVCVTFYAYTGEWITRGYYDVKKGGLATFLSGITSNTYVWVSFYENSKPITPQRIKVNTQQLNDDIGSMNFYVRTMYPFTIFQSLATPYAIEQVKFYRIDTSNESTEIVID